ncbi:Tetratricopeptide TPR_2 repeat protein (plasmid) [Herpetosiphon aurantiacus DSM 785]|uniref:Tetratricopeptide TPR_2 repeat protein n=1 Tax=Herpetosiphon aurantiacus (strain ATCC 23779 / DSM 785 / 114-95) TaxID=316274 RepID=A9B8W3_HERA2|nr:Tetratricopeptide TPR_2 repeat protein [Herpetosiphon aurantiacus DSM 785]
MHLLDIQHKISRLMARFVEEVKSSTAMGHSDINRVAETVLIPLLGRVYECPSLQNLNSLHPNYPAVDLGDVARRIAFQVTTTPDSKKIKDTLTTFIAHNLHTQFDTVYVYILTEKQHSYSPAIFSTITGNHLLFDPKRHILDANDLLKQIATYHVDKAQQILTILEANFDTPIDPLAHALAVYGTLPLDYVPMARLDLPQASRIPFESSAYFVGREAELKALARAIIQTQPTVVVPAVTTGLGGIGKTSLVTEFAYRYGVYFHGGIFWLNCADANQVASQIAACAVGLKIDTTGMALDEQVQQVLYAWQSPMPRLLIFDNCEDPAILTQWKPTIGGCRVLVTARSDQWPTLTQIRLGLLSPVESRALLQRLCTRLTDTAADAIAEDLGHLPLALHLAGSYLNTYSHHTVEQYRTELTIAHRSLKGRGAFPSPTQHELDVEATFMVSVNQLDPNDPIDALALGMLDGAAWCAPSVPLPRYVILSFVPDGTDGDDAVDALRRLQALGLLDGIETVILHRLLAQVIHVHMGWSATLALVEQRMVAAAEQAHKTGIPKQMNPLEPHLRGMTLRVLDRDTEQTARLATNLGLFAQHQGWYAEAQALHERAFGIRRVLVGENHSSTAMSINNLAEALHQQGRYLEAQDLFERALAVREVVLGLDHPDTARSVNNLALVLESQGRYSEAQDLFERALAVREAVLGLDHPDTAVSVNNLASVLESQGRYSEARGLYERALEVTEAVLGREHPDTARSVNNLASVLARQGRYSEAQPLYEQALAVNEAVLGREHPDTARSVNNLASVLESQGRYSEAQPLYEQALAVREAVLGENHPDTAMSMNNLAMVLLNQGRYSEAQGLLERTLTVHEAVLGAEHPDTAMSVNNLAVVLESQGRYSEAQGLLERALAVREAVLGAEHPDTAMSVNNLAGVLESQGRYGDAQRLYERALVVTEAVLGAEHPNTARSMNNLAMVLLNQRRYSEAQGLLERALTVHEAVLGAEHPDTAMSVHNLAVVLERQERYSDAQMLYERALAINKAVLGREHPDTMTTMGSLAGVLERQRQYGKAQSLYEHAFAIRKRVLGLTHPDTQSLQRDVGRVQRLHLTTKKKKRK